jgi:hypothetical protein
MREQLEHDISAIEREIRVAKESQVKLEKWDISTISTISNISQNSITDPFVGYKRQIL